MAKVVGDISVTVGADVSPLQQQLGRGKKSLRGFENSSEEMARTVAKAGAVVVTSIAAITTGVIAMAKQAAAAGIEIRNLSETAGTSTTAFQKMAEASKTVGIEQEKLSDILKDVNDKFGDFQATGAGPLADFFEKIAPKIGVTADQFARLSGPDALQLYVSSLERANVSQQEMTFYMEALASDSTRLLPLLRDNGIQMSRLGDEAQRAGRIMSRDTINAAVELDRAMSDMGQSLKTAVNTALLENSDELIALAKVMTETVIPAIGNLVGAFANIVGGLASVGTAAVDAGNKLVEFFEQAEQGSSKSRRDARNGGTDEGPDLTLPEFTQNQGGGRGGVVTGGFGVTGATGFTGEGGLLPAGMNTGTALDPSGGLLPPMGMTGATGFTGDGGLLPEESPIDAARSAWEKQQELNQEIEDGTADHERRLKEIADREMRELERIRETYAKNEIRTRSQTVDGAISLLGRLGGESEKFAKAAVALNAAKAIGETIQNTAAASVRALAELGPIAGPPAAAKIKLYGAAQVGLIAANAALSLGRKSGGGAGAGAGSGISSGAAAGASSGGGAGGGGGGQQPATTFAFTIQNDPMGFGEGFARQLIDQLNSTSRNGGQVRAVLNNA